MFVYYAWHGMVGVSGAGAAAATTNMLQAFICRS